MRLPSTDRIPKQIVVDWAIPLAIAIIGLVDIATNARSRAFPGAPALHVGFLLAGVIPLGLRRRAPILAPTSAIAFATGWASVWPKDSQASFEAFLVLVMAAYAIGAENRGKRLKRATALLVAYFVASQLVLLATGGSEGDVVPVVVWMTAAWGIGMIIRSRSDQMRRARALAAQLEAGAERRAAEAVEQERSRIARELHDVVAHGLSVVVVQAAAERRALAHGTADPASTDAVLESVERAGREALVDLRRLLGLVRQVDEPPALAPQPSLAEIDTLLAPIREAGVDIAVNLDGSSEDLPAGVDLTAYRIVQESLTNVLKHARANKVEVTIRHQQGRLDIEVVDDGRVTARDEPAAPGGGHGLLGMRERVSVFGGTLSAGPRKEGGWAVRARLPVRSSMLEAV